MQSCLLFQINSMKVDCQRLTAVHELHKM